MRQLAQVDWDDWDEPSTDTDNTKIQNPVKMLSKNISTSPNSALAHFHVILASQIC